MTIAAAYLTSEGVVLGADSTTTISVSGVGGVVQLFNHAQKVFEVGKDGRLGICTWGMGSVNGVSHRTLAARLGDVVDAKSLNVSDAADEFAAMVSGELSKDPRADSGLGYYVGGWTPGAREPACFQLTWDAARTLRKERVSVGSATFAGNPEYFTRIFRGYAPGLPQLLLEAIRKRSSALPPDFEAVFRDALGEITPQLAVAGARDIPIREAIDYVHSYLHVTIKAFKFKFGPPICGGPIEIGFITTDRHFRWACHKGFDTATFEQEAH